MVSPLERLWRARRRSRLPRRRRARSSTPCRGSAGRHLLIGEGEFHAGRRRGLVQGGLQVGFCHAGRLNLVGVQELQFPDYGPAQSPRDLVGVGAALAIG